MNGEQVRICHLRLVEVGVDRQGGQINGVLEPMIRAISGVDGHARTCLSRAILEQTQETELDLRAERPEGPSVMPLSDMMDAGPCQDRGKLSRGADKARMMT